MPESETNVTRREKLKALGNVAAFDPKLTILVIILGTGAAALEAVGLSFILPVIEIVQSSGDPTAEADGLMALFISVYQVVNIPFTFETVIVGVAAVLTLRYVSSFFVGWYKSALRHKYIEYLQTEAFDYALDARVSYYDKEGSDDILNAIITQAKYAGGVVDWGVRLIEVSLLSLVYLTIAFIISPTLTIFTLVLLGGVTYLLRNIVESGYELGDKVADANERRQEAAQAGTQGIRDIRIFGIADELRENFATAVRQYTTSKIRLSRNEVGLSNFYNLTIAVSIFLLIYLGVTFANLSFGALGVFLFAMFQLGPRASEANELFYKVENNLPHLVRTQQFVDSLSEYQEPSGGERPTPDTIESVKFDDIWFGYEPDEDVLQGIEFEAQRGEFIAFVGQSGAGKSTITSLLARMYEPDDGEILANSEPIHEMAIREWRDRLTIVRQDPFIFDDTLRYNLTIANRDATRDEIDRVCEIAKVDEFLTDLPNGYETPLGDQGVRLSGGQKQRVALARALLANADVLILDEATSDLDTNLENDVQEAIEEMERDYIIVTVAHRLSTVKNADRIYTVEDGQISEHGRHDELLNKNGKYSELYATQGST